MKRSSGILMPISSLPSPYGIGTLGKAAYEFVDFLKEAKQSWWQMLPVGPTSHGDSPYQSFSTYAGNPYFVDLDLLCEEGLVTQEELDAMEWGSNPQYVDYEKIYQSRFVVLKKALDRGWNKHLDEVQSFIDRNHDWLPDYALYMAVKRHFGMKAWTEWDEDIRMREPAAVKRYQEAVVITDEKPEAQPLIYARVTKGNVERFA
jgi:4-alpha-glucanotransferase